MACELVVVHDFTKQPGQTVQLDRYRFFGNPGTKTSRERTQDQTIGTATSRSIVKDNACVSPRVHRLPSEQHQPPEHLQDCSRDPDDRSASSAGHREPQHVPPVHRFADSAGRLSSLARSGVPGRTLQVDPWSGSDTQGGFYYPNGKGKTGVTVDTYTAAEFVLSAISSTLRPTSSRLLRACVSVTFLCSGRLLPLYC